jgi:hypothetical protein
LEWLENEMKDFTRRTNDVLNLCLRKLGSRAGQLELQVIIIIIIVIIIIADERRAQPLPVQAGIQGRPAVMHTK